MKYDWDTWDEKVNSALDSLDEVLAKEFQVEVDEIYSLLNRKDTYTDIRSAMSSFISYEDEE